MRKTRGKDGFKAPEKLPGKHIEAVAHLCHFMKQNRRLIHLDLSYMGMDEETLLLFGRTLRRCRGLLSLHLSGNPGNNLQVQEQLAEKIKCIPHDPVFKIEFGKLVNAEMNSPKKRVSMEDSFSHTENDNKLGEAIHFK